MQVVVNLENIPFLDAYYRPFIVAPRIWACIRCWIRCREDLLVTKSTGRDCRVTLRRVKRQLPMSVTSHSCQPVYKETIKRFNFGNFK